jgi:phage tail-like protein
VSAASRDNPYGAFNFRIMLDGAYVAGASLVIGMEANEAELGVSPSGGHVHYEPVILEGLVTNDPDFLEWARSNSPDAPESSDGRDTKQLVVEQYVDNNLKATHTVYSCWVSEYQDLPEVDANANLVPIQTMRLEHGGVHVRPAG